MALGGHDIPHACHLAPHDAPAGSRPRGRIPVRLGGGTQSAAFGQGGLNAAPSKTSRSRDHQARQIAAHELGGIMPDPEVNIPLLRKAVEWVEEQAAVPERDRVWYQIGVVTNAASIGRACGTCFCVAGYVSRLVNPDAAVGEEIDVAIDALGLPRFAGGLFSASNTAADVRRIAENIAGERL